MSEWWTYRLKDFLLFSPRTYERLFELYNAAIWPAQIVALGFGVAIWGLLTRVSAAGARWIAGILAGAWLWVAIAFQMSRYARINWAATYFGWAFVLEAALLLWFGVIRARLKFARRKDGVGWLGLGLLLFALWAQPLTGLLLGRSWRRLELFGVTPDPTVIATLGLFLLARDEGCRLLIVVPVIWCAVSGATLWAMKSSEAWIPPLAAAMTLIALKHRRAARVKEKSGRHLAELVR